MASFPVTACDSPRPLPWQARLPGGFRNVLLALAMVALLVLCLFVISRTDAELAAGSTAAESSEVIYLPSTEFLRAVSLRYEHALADILWFRAISYFGKHYRGDHVYRWLAHMCQVVTDLDPRAEHVYLFAGVMLPWEAERIDDGIALLEKGTRNFPESWRLHYTLGFSYYFFKDDLAAASRSLETAVRLPDTPEFVSRILATLFVANRGADDALAFLSHLEQDDVNGEMRGAIHQRVLEMQLTRDIDALQGAVKAFQASQQRPPVDLGELVARGFVTAVPPEPFGGQYRLGLDAGVVSSTWHEPRRLRHSAVREEMLKSKSAGGTP